MADSKLQYNNPKLIFNGDPKKWKAFKEQLESIIYLRGLRKKNPKGTTILNMAKTLRSSKDPKILWGNLSDEAKAKFTAVTAIRNEIQDLGGKKIDDADMMAYLPLTCYSQGYGIHVAKLTHHGGPD